MGQGRNDGVSGKEGHKEGGRKRREEMGLAALKCSQFLCAFFTLIGYTPQNNWHRTPIGGAEAFPKVREQKFAYLEETSEIAPQAQDAAPTFLMCIHWQGNLVKIWPQIPDLRFLYQ